MGSNRASSAFFVVTWYIFRVLRHQKLQFMLILFDGNLLLFMHVQIVCKFEIFLAASLVVTSVPTDFKDFGSLFLSASTCFSFGGGAVFFVQ